MKFALISPNEIAETGFRVAGVCDTKFEVADPLFWVECTDDVVQDINWYDPVTSEFKLLPVFDENRIFADGEIPVTQV